MPIAPLESLAVQVVSTLVDPASLIYQKKNELVQTFDNHDEKITKILNAEKRALIAECLRIKDSKRDCGLLIGFMTILESDLYKAFIDQTNIIEESYEAALAANNMQPLLKAKEMLEVSFKKENRILNDGLGKIHDKIDSTREDNTERSRARGSILKEAPASRIKQILKRRSCEYAKDLEQAKLFNIHNFSATAHQGNNLQFPDVHVVVEPPSIEEQKKSLDRAFFILKLEDRLKAAGMKLEDVARLADFKGSLLTNQMIYECASEFAHDYSDRFYDEITEINLNEKLGDRELFQAGLDEFIRLTVDRFKQANENGVETQFP